jgi:hypothetical protein
MAVAPIVRYMLLCEDWKAGPNNPSRVTIIGLIGNIRALDQPPYPLLYPELCVFLALTEGRGKGRGKSFACSRRPAKRCLRRRRG